MPQIVIDPIKLRAVASDLDDATLRLTQISDLGERTITTAPQVEAAYAKFSGQWDDRRGQLSDQLKEISNSIRTAATSFEEADRELSESLSCPAN